ncbi:hypothetical protein [Alistipes onderdonkii]|uniref:hypothetical protein n=1 Tax=Alistipes onderdonkii TaxID=328813 RepID=UPI0036F1F8A4
MNAEIPAGYLSRPARAAALVLCAALLPLSHPAYAARKIDRKAVVTRHNPEIREGNLRGPMQVGNGEFAFGFDISGMQTFSDNANTMSNWGWYRFPLPQGQRPEDFRGAEWEAQGRMVRYDIPNPEQGALRDWMVRNPQRINLGRIGLVLIKDDGSRAGIGDLTDPVQRLDLWTGTATSRYSIDGREVVVTTVGHPEKDAVAVRIESEKVADGTVGISLRFPFPSNTEFGSAADWDSPGRHLTELSPGTHMASFHRQLDDTNYDVHVQWDAGAVLRRTQEHCYELIPATDAREISFVVCFDKIVGNAAVPTFAQTRSASTRHWREFWEGGGAIDLSGSSDPRWRELERRVVLSQYVMAVNEAGSLPPQESGLVNNGWYGKYHHEMIWWHCTHYALWGRWKMASGMMEVFADNLATYRRKAAMQGYDGARWPKTIGDHAWWEWPLETTALLIWQQPHPIFYAELEYRQHPTRETLEKWRDVVFETADFMASYAHYDAAADRYVLGYPLQVVGENADPRTTVNPTFELSYWLTGLRIAGLWRERLGLPAKAEYGRVYDKLSPLPVQEGVYVSWENIEDMWTRYNWEHPALIGAYGMLPGDGVDIPTMERTLMKVHREWKLHETWGWDFPMLAMCAARLGKPEMAVDYLLDYPAFDFDACGLVGGGRAPFPYFPGNGGLLYAVAMMAAGWDGAPSGNAPGFPSKGWVVKHEGLHKAL